MQRVVVVLPNWYGETLFATPFLRALRRGRPEVSITTLGWPQCREVLQHNPHVSEHLDYDERASHGSLMAMERMLLAVRGGRFDMAFVLRPSFSRTLVLTLAGVPVRVGFNDPKSAWLLTQRVAQPAGAAHKAATYLPLLQAVGMSASLDACDYTVGDEERRAAGERLRLCGLVNGRPLVILHPGANWAHKRWPAERFAALGDRLSQSLQAQIVVTGGPDDIPLAASVAGAMRQSSVVLAGRTTLRELGACLEHASLIVSNDTGVLHMAAALQRPLVALYGPTSPSFTGPLGDPRRTVVLHHPGCCPQIPCYAPDQPAHPGMHTITVDEAYEAAVQLLGR